MTTIIDYGLGNIQAIVNVYRRLHIPVSVAKTESDLSSATHLILPGVGSFDHAMRTFTESGMRETVTNMVFKQNIPVLGICVGMQMLAQQSDEGDCEGLGWISGRVKSLKTIAEKFTVPLPHMGWNDVFPAVGHPLFKGMESESRFYFLHSYYFECENKKNIAAEVDYGERFTCTVSEGHIFGAQFHPEKSHQFGTQLLKNFAEL
ncbi:MAG: imidazole glycerol phosphate synthase subunit HisH [Pseudobdellovibrio sp.]